jgi:hypothetical protein
VGDRINSVRVVRRLAFFAVGLLVVGAVIGLTLVTWDRTGHAGTGRTSSTIMLTCADSAGQQGSGGETVVGGVEGLVLPGSGNPASLTPWRATNGRRYFFYKVFLAVSRASAPYATVSIIRPNDARLVYGPAATNSLSGRARISAMVAASRRQVRLPVCGPRFTGFVGAVVLVKPTYVTFSVSSPARRSVRTTVPLGNT